MIEPLFKPGDVVRVRDLRDLVEEFGTAIRVPSSWVDEMDDFCGNVFTIESRVDTLNGITNAYYFCEDDMKWMFDECVLECYEPVDTHGEIDPESFSIKYDDII